MDLDRYFLEMALGEAEKALEENTYPVGAVIVDEHFNLVAKGRNRVHPSQDITAHAEMDAIRNAGTAMFDAKIKHKKFTLYSSLEPCPMCTGGILFAKIQRVVWLLNDDHGFGGYKRLKDASVFLEKFDRIEVMEEPFEDLKNRQKELMISWETNANNVTSLRNRH
ncbi:nucleoside deaminase [Psychrobacillus sp. BL-248-WT-3]|uniref:nucleoside deaminase n=1 Tax=Psychrobacillus sp. BL-248-WT-3 TaxID=2725306 RepID=UPI00146A467C|nr:nucleoside deaminase [Psychrobacillus sp. BL-248-WT-3]NME05570.1 nucleoside deaminase [Psychrobacillus sp. BL-248-WT-3]